MLLHVAATHDVPFSDGIFSVSLRSEKSYTHLKNSVVHTRNPNLDSFVEKGQTIRKWLKHDTALGIHTSELFERQTQIEVVDSQANSLSNDMSRRRYILHKLNEIYIRGSRAGQYRES